jgi:hypothetical protein
MIFRQEFLDGIRDGTITLAFRRWRRPTVRSGGSLLTAVGELHIASVATFAIERITDADARRAGYASREALVAELNARAEGEVYRIELGALRADPRIHLRVSLPSDREIEELRVRLERLDRRADGEPWTWRVLELLRDHPGVRAADLCVRVGQPRDEFKGNVRKLKALGLTESLEVGYRLSPRGEALLRHHRPEVQ